MATILQATFSNTLGFFLMNDFEFWVKFDKSLFPKVQNDN